MSFIFGKQKEPERQILTVEKERQPSAEEIEAAATAKAEADERERRKKAKGGAATILTSSQGLTSSPTLLTKALLGE
jgi:hypothetical protein